MPKMSDKYQKIMSVYFRDPETNRFLEGQWSTPEIKMLKDINWVFTEKVDGTNIRVTYKIIDGTIDGIPSVTFAGRSDEASIPSHLLNKLITMFQDGEKIELLKSVFGSEPDTKVVLYGEGYGPKIQKGGGNYCKEASFVLFDIKIGDMMLRRHDVDDIAKKLGIMSVPIVGHGTLEEAIEITKKGMKSQWGDFIAEGIVARPEDELFTRRGDRIIVKVKYKDFH